MTIFYFIKVILYVITDDIICKDFLTNAVLKVDDGSGKGRGFENRPIGSEENSLERAQVVENFRVCVLLI